MENKLVCLTDIGNRRKNNEDIGYVSKNNHGTLLLVCDGMGGHKKGEIASSLIVDVISNDFNKRRLPLNSQKAKKYCKKLYRKANKAVFEKSLENDDFKEMGSTAVMALVLKDSTHIISVGDSRCYSFSKDKGLKQETVDQTYVEFLLESGQISKEEALSHPQKNLLLNAMGITHELSNIEEKTIKNSDYDSLLLCSDGLYNMIKDKEMEDILKDNTLSTNEKAKKMISIALNNGGNDNITIAIMEK